MARLLLVLCVVAGIAGLIIRNDGASIVFPGTVADKPMSLQSSGRGSRVGPLSRPFEAKRSALSSKPSQRPVDPKKVCRIITVGDTPANWAASPVAAGEWECFSDTRPSLESRGEQTAANSTDIRPQLFLIARGKNQEEIDSLRIKLSAVNSEAATLGAAAVIGKLKELYQLLDRPIPSELVHAISELRPCALHDGEIELRFSKEFGNSLRYNLFVEFP